MRSTERFALLCVTVTVAALSTACANMSGLSGSSEYGCKAPIGVRCDSVSGTYHNAIAGNLPKQSQGRPNAPTGVAPALDVRPTPAPHTDLLPTRALPTSAGTESPEISSAPLRSAARILRLWAKAWEDADADLYGDSYLWIQVDSGRWLVEHAQRVTRDAYGPIRPPRAAASTRAIPADSGGKALPTQAPEAHATPIDDALKSLQARPGSSADPE